MNEALQIQPGERVSSDPSPADCTPDQLAETRYNKALDDLLTDAWDAKRMHILADSLAWTVARIAVGCGMAATGDMLRRIGEYVGRIETQRQATQEAQQARKDGRVPH